MQKIVERNYRLIFKNILNYLPSRVLIIIYSLVIIPFFAYILNAKEMSVYLIALQILNLICSWSSDWVAKSILRFFEKHSINNSLNHFFSTIICLAIFLYILIFILYFTLGGWVCKTFSIEEGVFFLTILLTLPCGIRQMLYQTLRTLNQYKLYISSIFIYQMFFVITFLALMNVFPNTQAILLSMNIAVFLIDIYVIKKINLKILFEPKIYLPILKEILRYAIPVSITSLSYWILLNVSKFMFQERLEFENTSLIGVTWIFLSSIILPLASVFLFATFPMIVKRYELQHNQKTFYTNILQLFNYVLIPVVSVFCYFPKEIVSIFLPKEYNSAYIIFPLIALVIFVHEFTKIINIKYHLKNRTFIEMILAIFFAAVSCMLNVFLIAKYSVFGAALALFISEALLLAVSLLINFKSLKILNYAKFRKTTLYTIAMGILSYFAVLALTFNLNQTYDDIVKVILFLGIYGALAWTFQEKALG